jgi:hypothetical protein
MASSMQVRAGAKGSSAHCTTGVDNRQLALQFVSFFVHALRMERGSGYTVTTYGQILSNV